ncbi:MAG TPA: LLM class flavin-dependent oxidoreductase [Acidimicrobiales bacterium]|jgi:alkanesulfonate monooxygenase SsuD/methylene tetrahydromethanopterin reductase-like flavin-dependent oxidoreductase (luciferase family)|nr:LLM class flavin-dependent oxidoreductase [Acidimicrobiales bacterium]
MTMEFGLFIGGWVPDYLDGRDDAHEHERLLNEVRVAVAGDRSGWKYVWVTEHHFLTEYSHISANEIVMPHILAKTERIRVASGIINVTPPVNHPARIAERVAMLDHLSGGRFDFGTGRGSSTTEQGGFGIQDPDLTRDMFDEVMPEFRKMWAQDSYSFEGRFFAMPERNVLPKPYVKPHPPMWVAAGNPETFQKAGELGLGVICFTGGSPDKMRGLVETYKEAVADAKPVGDYVNDNVAVTTNFLCLNDGDRARDLMTHSRNGRQQSLVFKYLDTFPKPPMVPDWPIEIPDPTLEQLEAGFEKGTSIVGSPDDCAEALAKWDGIGVDQLIMGPTGTTWPIEVVEESVELFGNQVIPKFDASPDEARAVRFRREAAERLGLA